MKRVSTRLPEADVATLAEVEAALDADRAEVLRRLIRQGLDDWRRERALEDLRNHDITIRNAAERAGLRYVDMLTLASEAGIDIGYSLEDLEADLDR